MPSKKYIITLQSGTWNGIQLVKYSQRETDQIIQSLDDMEVKYKVEIIDLF
jgi:hypothetical protein